MALSRTVLKRHLDGIAGADRDVCAWLERVGYPAPRSRPRGYEALLRTLIGQQISIAAARGITLRLEGVLGSLDDPVAVLEASDETLRAGGLSRQKVGYARSLAEAVVSGALDFRRMTRLDDEAAIAMLSSVRGFGRWSAEIYLMFAEGRHDIWPAGDLGVQEGLRRLRGLDERPGERAMRTLADCWRPHRSSMALFCWHVYANSAPLQ